MQFFHRGPGPLARLVFFATLSLLLLFIDARYRYLESTRSALSAVISPIQRLATVPGMLWRQAGDFLVTQHHLVSETADLKLQHQRDTAQLLQLQAVKAENQQLRNLLELSQRAPYSTQMAEIIYAERDVFTRKVLINKGANTNLQPGLVVMDSSGIIGQVTRVYPWLSEVTLITEKDQAVPVQVLRNGLRTVIFGAGDASQLALRFVPISADVQNGDVLVTSGIDGFYPAGIPVAKVVKIERDAAYPFARILCLPIAGVDKHRHLLVITSLVKLPERPAADVVAPNSSKNAKARLKK
jgi:rod shape-determining protein MreC